jgi:protein SCO1/2
MWQTFSGPGIRLIAAVALSLLFAAATPAQQGHEHDAHMRAMQTAAAGGASPDGISITRQNSYALPKVQLRDEAGTARSLTEVLADNRPVVLNFIYTSCTTICPVQTASLLQMQRLLAGGARQPDYVSISIDPEFDSPMVLQAYAKRFGANWRFLTGSRAEIEQVLRAFDAWRGSKANHSALTLMKLAGSKTWTRVDGLAPAAQLASTWKALAL